MMSVSRLSSRLTWCLSALMVLTSLLLATSAFAGPSSTTTSISTSGSQLIPPLSPCKEGHHQLTIVVTTDAQNVAIGDYLWDSHHEYIRDSHKSFLVSYGLTKGPELASPFNPASEPTGRTTYVLNECYRTSEDILAHWAKTDAEWEDFEAIIVWMQTPGTTVVTLHDGTVRNALWQLDDIL
jgi:hypothetical protein